MSEDDIYAAYMEFVGQAEVFDYKRYFYEYSDKLPDEPELERCKALAIRIMSAMTISEKQLLNIPFEFVESFYNYKEKTCTSAIAEVVFEECPFIYKELMSSY